MIYIFRQIYSINLFVLSGLPSNFLKWYKRSISLALSGKRLPVCRRPRQSVARGRNDMPSSEPPCHFDGSHFPWDCDFRSLSFLNRTTTRQAKKPSVFKHEPDPVRVRPDGADGMSSSHLYAEGERSFHQGCEWRTKFVEILNQNPEPGTIGVTSQQSKAKTTN